MRLELPYPPAILSPNKRPHWAAKAKAVASYRSECGWRARAQGADILDVTRLEMRITFHPPDLRRRDCDNLISATKALRDGLMDAIGVDDSGFVVTYEMAPPIKGGLVVVEWNE